MVDPYQVLIDNGLDSSVTNKPNKQCASISLMQTMSGVSDKQTTAVVGQLDNIDERAVTSATAATAAAATVVSAVKNVLVHSNERIMGGPSNHETETIVVTSDDDSNSGDATTTTTQAPKFRSVTNNMRQGQTNNTTNSGSASTPPATIPLSPSRNTSHITVHGANTSNNTILIEIGEKLPPRTVPNSTYSARSPIVTAPSTPTATQTIAFNSVIDVDTTKPRESRAVSTVMDRNNYNHSKKVASSSTTTNDQLMAAVSPSLAVAAASNEIDSRKVEPIRIKLQQAPPPPEPDPISSSSATILVDTDNDDGTRTPPSPNAVPEPRYTIKPVIPATMHSSTGNDDNHYQEAIPKLKIKKDSSSSMSLSTASNAVSITEMPSNDASFATVTTNVPKRTNRNATSTTMANATNSKPTNEVIPKLTIKLDPNHGHSNHYLHSHHHTSPSASSSPTSSPSSSSSSSSSHYHHHNHHANNASYVMSDRSDQGIKVTFKPLPPEPPLKMTIKTNANNDTAEVVMNHSLSPTVKHSPVPHGNAATGVGSNSIKLTIKPIVQPDDETINEQNQIGSINQSQSHKSHKSKGAQQQQRATLAAQANTVSSSSASTPIGEDNLSTCSSGSSSSFSSYSSTTAPNEDIKLIIKTTKTGSCVVNSTSTPSTSEQHYSRHNNTNSNNNLNSNNGSNRNHHHHHHHHSASSSHDDSTGPAKNVPVSSTSTPSPTIPKISKRPPEDGCVIPKVRIKPLLPLLPNEEEQQPRLVTPKIILKPIPKPSESTEPLEVITSPLAENECQKSPRIILKINKNNATSHTTEAIVLTPTNKQATASTSDDAPALNNSVAAGVAAAAVSSTAPPTVVNSNCESRTSDATTTRKRDATNVNNDTNDDDVLVLSSDSDSETPTKPVIVSDTPRRPSQTSLITDYFSSASTASDGTSKLARALQGELQSSSTTSNKSSESEKNLTTVPENAEQTAASTITPATTVVASASASTSSNTTTPLSEKLKSKLNWTFFDNEPKEAPVAVHPLLQHHIERSRLLEVLMNQAAEKDKAQEKSKALLLNNEEGSSSDCIVVEDTGSDALPEFGARAGQNGEKKESSGDRDSGVDVSNATKASNDGTPAAKRPRGRPRKDGTPAGTIKYASL